MIQNIFLSFGISVEFIEYLLDLLVPCTAIPDILYVKIFIVLTCESLPVYLILWCGKLFLSAQSCLPF